MDGTGPGLAKGPKKGQWDLGTGGHLAGLLSGPSTGAGGGGLVRLRGNWPKSALEALSRAGAWARILQTLSEVELVSGPKIGSRRSKVLELAGLCRLRQVSPAGLLPGCGPGSRGGLVSGWKTRYRAGTFGRRRRRRVDGGSGVPGDGVGRG